MFRIHSSLVKTIGKKYPGDLLLLERFRSVHNDGHFPIPWGHEWQWSDATDDGRSHDNDSMV